MGLITRSCVLFVWMHTLALVKSRNCTREQFFLGPLYDSNFDTTTLEASYPDGKQVRVSCNIGYSGFFKLVCKNGIWDSKGNRCAPRSCGHPGDAQFADFHLEKGEDFVFGSQVVFTCQKGYQMVSRRNVRYCMAEGWDGVVPVCEALQCPVVHVDSNVQVIGDPNESTYGNVIRFTCKSRSHMLVGSQEMYCDENGEWNGQPPECKEIQCAVPNIEKGVVEGNRQQYKEHDVVYFRCVDGYKRIDARPSVCTKRGTTAEFRPTPSCEPIICRLPMPVEGTSYEGTKNVFSPGDSVTVTCGMKHWIINTQITTASSTCQDNGEWSLRPYCQEVECRSNTPRHVRWNVKWNQVIKLDDTVHYSCVTGYKTTNDATHATCTRNGWEPNPFCQEITCNREDDQNAHIVNTDKTIFKYWDRVNYVCKLGYEGHFTLTCQKTGWTGTRHCEKVCNKLSIDNTRITYNEKDDTYKINEKVRYVCNNDAERVFTLTCEHSGWTGIKNCSACPTADVPNGFVVGPYNGTVYYTCNKGYKLYTEGWWAEAKCTNSEWSGLERCIDNTMCGKFPKIPHGKVTPPRGSYENARITCDHGYLAQVTHLTCQRGKWFSNRIPPKTICRPTAAPCKPPPKVDNAVIMKSYQKEYLPDSTVTYRCRDMSKSISLEHEHTIKCKDGKWEEKNIMCTSYCNQLKDELMTFTADQESYMDGDVIEYQCVISGAKGNATCKHTEWNKSEECEGCAKPVIDDAQTTFIEKDIYRLNDKAYFKCNGGRSFSITCERSGWTGDMDCTAPNTQ